MKDIRPKPVALVILLFGIAQMEPQVARYSIFMSLPSHSILDFHPLSPRERCRSQSAVLRYSFYNIHLKKVNKQKDSQS